MPRILPLPYKDRSQLNQWGQLSPEAKNTNTHSQEFGHHVRRETEPNHQNVMQNACLRLKGGTGKACLKVSIMSQSHLIRRNFTVFNAWQRMQFTESHRAAPLGASLSLRATGGSLVKAYPALSDFTT